MTHKKPQGTEKEYMTAITELFEEWIEKDIFKSTETYRKWQHDKGSFGFGYIMGLKAAVQKLRERRDLL